MPKNEHGQVTCINAGKTINGNPNHTIIKVDGNAIMPRGDRDHNGNTLVDTSKVQEFDVYVCENCKYSELYKRI